jgi:uncharacterized protein involved in outer membrane biogenesis
MMVVRIFKWMAAVLLALVMLAVSFVVIFGWNWMRAPIERMALEQTGRELHIGGDIDLTLGWPWPRLHAGAVTFANPPWAKNPQMVSAEGLDVTVDLPQLLRKNLVFPEVRLDRPRVSLEQGSEGRKSWLLDRNQQDESAVIQIGRLTLDQGTLSYDDAAEKTSIQAELSTAPASAAAASAPGVTFSAQGRYKGLPLKATGSGGSVLALRFDQQPYPLKIDGSVGRTSVRADGSITSLLKFSAIDMRLALRGDSLDQLFPLLGIALPATRAYAVDGQLLHSGKQWQYQKFSGRIGASDIAGSLQVDVGGPRPALTAELNSRLLDLADLGPLIGARPGKVQTAKQAAPARAATPVPTPPTPRAARVLPDLPFKTERWNSVDAEVTLRAATLRRAKALPLENLLAHLSLRDSVLTLDPLNFGLAGGQLNAVISLDGRQDPIQAKARVKALKVQVGKLFPSFDLSRTGIGQINGEFNLAGNGNSVGRMLASADGKVGLVVAGGKISKLMMEMAGLHLWEILELKLSGDRQIKLRCAVADFDVKHGVLHTDALIFDTEVTTLIGTGSIDLGQETIDLTLNQKTKNTSPLALRSPIHVRGSFVKPTVGVDKGRVALRALGALGLGLINPFLTLLPLIDAGPGKDSDCGQLVQEARAAPSEHKKAEAPK